MLIVWLAFFASLALLYFTVRDLVLYRLRGKTAILKSGEAKWYVWATLLFLEVCGLIGTVPGLFFDRPHWAADQVFHLVELLLR